MRQGICGIALGVFAAFAPTIANAQNTDSAHPTISLVRFGADVERTRIVIESDRELAYRAFTLAENGDRLVVDLEPVTWALDADPIGGGQRAAAGEGVVARYRFAQQVTNSARLVFDLAEPAAIRSHFALPPVEQAQSHRRGGPCTSVRGARGPVREMAGGPSGRPGEAFPDGAGAEFSRSGGNAFCGAAPGYAHRQCPGAG